MICDNSHTKDIQFLEHFLSHSIHRSYNSWSSTVSVVHLNYQCDSVWWWVPASQRVTMDNTYIQTGRCLEHWSEYIKSPPGLVIKITVIRDGQAKSWFLLQVEMLVQTFSIKMKERRTFEADGNHLWKWWQCEATWQEAACSRQSQNIWTQKPAY